MRIGVQTRTPDTTPLVLIVDDDRDNREMYGIFLRHSGFRVRLAPNTEAALAEFAVEAPQVVVTDVAMPGQDGLKLCRAIRELRSHEETGIIALTGLLLKQRQRDELIAAGSDEILVKPCLPETLLEQIRLLLARCAALRAHAARARERARALTDQSAVLQKRSADLGEATAKRRARRFVRPTANDDHE